MQLKTSDHRMVETRERISNLFKGDSEELFISAGPCAPDLESMDQLIDEAHDLRFVFRSLISHTVATSRLPIWKPRSNPETSWNGMETTHPIQAESLIERVSFGFGSAAIEIGSSEHISKYMGRLAFGWIGSRNFGDSELLDKLANLSDADKLVPVGIKNDMDGDIDSAIDLVKDLNQSRGSHAAPAVLIFRGGENLKTPELWENAYLRAWQATNGRFIVDAAHGGEMSHDPDKQFNKSVQGQIDCLDHIIDLSRQGNRPAGVMLETSNAPSQIDPVIPFQIGIEKVIELRRSITL